MPHRVSQCGLSMKVVACIKIGIHSVFFNVECDVVISTKHLGEIADELYGWEGRIADELGLTEAEVAAIKLKHDRELNLQT